MELKFICIPLFAIVKLSFNRTAYGIEIHYEIQDRAMHHLLLIAPLMELKLQ